jgi:hypothetical protein
MRKTATAASALPSMSRRYGFAASVFAYKFS